MSEPNPPMERVTGIGGVFFKSEDPKKLIAWYAERLGIVPQWEGGTIFRWRGEGDPDGCGYTEDGRFGWATDPEGNRIELWEPRPGRLP